MQQSRKVFVCSLARRERHSGCQVGGGRGDVIARDAGASIDLQPVTYPSVVESDGRPQGEGRETADGVA